MRARRAHTHQRATTGNFYFLMQGEETSDRRERMRRKWYDMAGHDRTQEDVSRHRKEAEDSLTVVRTGHRGT